MTFVNSMITEDSAREIAGKLEAEHPLWIVVFGVYTKEFVCFPKFDVPSGTIVAARYPGAIPDRMRRVEESVSKAEAA